LELAKILVYQGKSGEALPLLEPALPAGSVADLVVRRKIFLSIALARTGHLDEAEQMILEVVRECPEGPLQAEVWGAQGVLEIATGRFDNAERVLRSSLDNARRNGKKFLETEALLNLSAVALREEHYEDALALSMSASALAESIGSRLELEKSAGNIGWVYYKTGDFPRSLASYKEADKQAAELGSTIDEVHWLNNAGLNAYQMGDFAAARPFYERSLQLGESIQNQELILDAHVDLGFLLLRINDPSAAATHVKEANRIAALDRNKRTALEPALLDALLLDARGDKKGATEELRHLEEHTSGVPSLQWETESSLARIYSSTGRPGDAERWFQRAIDTFQRQRSSLTSVESTLPFLANGNDLYASYAEHLIQEKKTDEALNVVDESRAESLEDGLHLSRIMPKGQSSRSFNARSIAARLQATILVYSLRPKVSYLWAITPTRQDFYQIAGSETILPLVQSHTKMILASKDLLTQVNAPGGSLYKELVEPVRGLIKKGSRVFIVGDDALSGLNFDTLQTPGDDSHYWIEDVAITNAKSLRLLSVKGSAEPHYADRRLLLIGDPVYRKDEFAELPHASAEVAKIASHFSADRREVFTGAEASPEAYQRSRAGEFSYIHFVAHGTANMTSPLDSAVVLSKDPDDATVYKLYARDILKQNLHADLVTVSACNGSGVRNYSGEGLVGLAWAFLRAGSHHVIGAMWEVSDVSTPLLMDHLYGELAKGSQPDVALRAAKLAMIHSDGVFRKPLYWAPFQLYSGA
jgi:CHAT domain-containing protein/Tfp pilus assembly protein PilF